MNDNNHERVPQNLVSKIWEAMVPMQTPIVYQSPPFTKL